MGINYLAVVVAAVAGFVVGALWYSPFLFSKEWMRLLGRTPEDFHKKTQFTPAQAMVGQFILMLVIAYVLAILSIALGITSLTAALTLAFWLWLGFLATEILTGVFFEGRPIKLFLLNGAERLIMLLVMAVIVGLWH